MGWEEEGVQEQGLFGIESQMFDSKRRAKRIEEEEGGGGEGNRTRREGQP